MSILSKINYSMTRYRYIPFYVLLLCLLITCGKDYIKEDENVTGQIDTEGVNEDEDDYVLDSTRIVQITLEGNSATVDTPVVNITSNIITITAAGTYNITGTLTDGQIIVNTDDESDVKIILDNVNINCSTSAPIYVSNAEKVILVLADQSENYLSDGTSYQNLVDDEPSAAIFSKSDLSIYGDGELTVDANYNDGITSKDGLIIKSGTITVNSVDDGIRGKDYIIFYNGNITVNAGGDGLKSDNADDVSLGFISITTGLFDITASGDAIAAQTIIEITDGEYELTSGGGSNRNVSQLSSAKGIKGIESIIIDGGTFTISSADDGLHSDNSLEVTGANIDLASGDDGIHSDGSVTITDSYLSITKSFEAIESANITINSSTIRLVASDDGFNSTMGSATEANDGSCLTINGGSVYVSTSAGDALDSNGDIKINGGTIIAHGPSSDPELGLDVNGSCTISGGFFIVSELNSNMGETPSSSSSQYSVVIKFTSSHSANSIVHIEDSEGNDVLTFAPERTYESITFSSSDLKSGATYTIYTGGTCTGTATDGLYTGGTYSGGTSYTSFTISSLVTTVGSSSGGPSGGGGRR